MIASQHASDLGSLVAPLMNRFGNGLAVARDGERVRWTYDGRSALVSMRSDGVADAMFVDRPEIDAVSKSPTAAVYRAKGRGYALTATGCAAMAADILAFFSGVREPAFTFAAAVAAE